MIFWTWPSLDCFPKNWNFSRTHFLRPTKQHFWLFWLYLRFLRSFFLTIWRLKICKGRWVKSTYDTWKHYNEPTNWFCDLYLTFLKMFYVISQMTNACGIQRKITFNIAFKNIKVSLRLKYNFLFCRMNQLIKFIMTC